MKTKITRLRNLMTPICNYSELLKSEHKVTKDSLQGFNNIVEYELNQIHKNLPEIREILDMIPDNACEGNNIEPSESNAILPDVIAPFAENSNEGNEKREELISYYKENIDNWTGTYSEGFADAFNWLSKLSKANVL